MSEIILIRGLPGSGKSTLARKLASEARKPTTHIETDMYFEDSSGNYTYDPTKIKEAHSWCQQRADDLLNSGQRVIVSNTFTQRWEMEPYRALAEKHRVPLRILVCTGSFENVHGVPDTVIERMRARWES